MATGSAAQYAYSKLPESDSIRLIVLEPSSDLEAPVHCSLIQTTLLKYSNEIVDHYIALSYVWGDATKRAVITIEPRQQELEVTASLECALRHMRDHERPLKVWADGVCINQEDVEERNQQVAQMGRVYSTARHTIIFLGRGCPKTDLTFQLIQALEISGQLGEPSIDPASEWQGAVKILGHPWFSRIWVLQELLMSPDPWVQCGTLRIRWNVFCNRILSLGQNSDITSGKSSSEIGSLGNGFNSDPTRLSSFQSHSVLEDTNYPVSPVSPDPHEATNNKYVRRHGHPRQAHCDSFSSYGSSEGDDEIRLKKAIPEQEPEIIYREHISLNQPSEEELPVYPFVNNEREHRKRLANINELYKRYLQILHRIESRDDTSNQFFLEVLIARRGLGVKDPRDVVYGHLALNKFDKNQANIVVDYDLSCAQVYEKITRHLLKNNSQILRLSGESNHAQGSLILPSWIPDWSITNKTRYSPIRDQTPLECCFEDKMPGVFGLASMEYGEVAMVVSRSRVQYRGHADAHLLSRDHQNTLGYDLEEEVALQLCQQMIRVLADRENEPAIRRLRSGLSKEWGGEHVDRPDSFSYGILRGPIIKSAELYLQGATLAILLNGMILPVAATARPGDIIAPNFYQSVPDPASHILTLRRCQPDAEFKGHSSLFPAVRIKHVKYIGGRQEGDALNLFWNLKQFLRRGHLGVEKMVIFALH